MKIHHRHQQANISNSIFKLNIVRFMHTKMERWEEIYSANIHPELCTFSIFAEARIFNYKLYFAFLSIPRSFFAHPAFRTVNKVFSAMEQIELFAPFRSTHFHVMLYFDRYVLE